MRLQIGLADDGWSRRRSRSCRRLGCRGPLGPRHRHRYRGCSNNSGSSRLSHRATAPRHDVYGGTGLGLSISRPWSTCSAAKSLSQHAGRGQHLHRLSPRRSQLVRLVTEPSVCSRHSSAASVSSAVTPGRRRSPTRKSCATRIWPCDDHPFAGTKFLVVDDDFRNIFALTALLERGRAEVVVRRKRRRRHRLVKQTPDIDIVLMDIMMPGMDGYATIRAIRALERLTPFPSSPSRARSSRASASGVSRPEPTTTYPSRSTRKGCSPPRALVAGKTSSPRGCQPSECEWSTPSEQ